MLHIGSDNSIALTRGDTAYLQVPIELILSDGTTEPYEIQDEDTLTLSIKRYIKDEAPCVSKRIVGSNTFHILPTDTCECAFGKYLYDVQLVTAEGDVYTVIEPTTFEILKEVTC